MVEVGGMGAGALNGDQPRRPPSVRDSLPTSAPTPTASAELGHLLGAGPILRSRELEAL
jgi:hypothetical protein